MNEEPCGSVAFVNTLKFIVLPEKNQREKYDTPTVPRLMKSCMMSFFLQFHGRPTNVKSGSLGFHIANDPIYTFPAIIDKHHHGTVL